MASIDTLTTATRAPRASFFERAVETLAVWHERARQRAELAALGDDMLKDIGLSRADIEHETIKPFWQA